MRYWKTKTFFTRDDMDAWIAKNNHKYQIVEIFINNGYGVEYRELIQINC